MLNRWYCASLLTASFLLSGCGANATDAALDSITVTSISAAPVIATQPVGLRVAAGQAATLSVSISVSGAGTLAYQWQKDGVAIAGATQASYSIAAAASADAGSYAVVVTNDAGSVTSAPAMLTVASVTGVPVVVAQPASQTVALGAGVTLTVSVTVSLTVPATGSGALAYQWRRDGVAIPGASAVSYTIPIARAADAGSYDVVVTNANGSATSALATLEVTAVTATTAHSLATYNAAMAFYGTLTAAQQAALQLPWRLDTARRWSTQPSTKLARNGLALATLDAVQLAAARALVTVALGETGSALFFGMQAAGDQLAAGGAGSAVSSDDHLALLGAPSSTGFWMLQLSRRQLAWNLAYNGRYDGPTPLFLDIEPAGAFTLGDVSYDPVLVQRSSMADLGAALVAYPAAKLAGSYPDLLFGANDADGIDASCPRAYESVTSHGALYSSLSVADQATVQSAIRSYVQTQARAGASTLVGAYLSSEALAQTTVAYAGTGSLADQGTYLRIEGPRLWIEWSVQRGGASSGALRYQTIWRDKFADYGGKCG